MEEAALLLRESDWSVSRIMNLIGLRDAGYFARQFVRQFGILPSEYRRAHRDQSDIQSL